MEEIIYNVLSAILSAVITFTVTFIATNIVKNNKAQKVHNKAVKDMLISMGALELYNLYTKCETQGYRRPVDTLAFKKLVSPYYDLGGNDYIHTVERDFYNIVQKDV